ncbi:hypothetical protein JTB14_010654 [Gonioctena quinquepunctata]|nr:hypothetical protein JTB14_010654 [Gonioctena quinquepunctata]
MMKKCLLNLEKNDSNKNDLNVDVTQAQEVPSTSGITTHTSHMGAVGDHIYCRRNYEKDVESVEIIAPQNSQEMISEKDEDKEDEVPRKKRRKSMRLYRFQNDWCEIPEFKGWLVQSKNCKGNNIEFAYCQLCKREIFPHKSDLYRHSKSDKHMTNARMIGGCKPIVELLQPKSSAVKIAELKLVGLLATNNLPFVLMDTLVPLCADIFSDSDIAKAMSCKRTKATAILKAGLGKNFQEELCDKVRFPGQFFSLIMDETTDVGTIRQCAFTIIFYDITNKVKTRFLDMAEVAQGDAVSLHNCLKGILKKHQIPLDNLVGFSSDTTNVMVGEKNSIFSHLKSEKPEIVCIKCSCHMIHLAASAACLQLPRSVEDVLRNIGAHFSKSYSRQEKFREFQNFFDTGIHKIVMPSITRWLSLEQCVKRVLEQYEPLCAYFRLINFEDHSKTTEMIINTLENKYTLIYFQFMAYILEILNDFNKMFRSESSLLHKLKPEIMRMLKMLCCNFINREVILQEQKNILNINHTNPHNFLPLENIYLGVAAFETIQVLKSENKCDKTEIDVFLKSCLKFYIELISEIKKRFMFTDPIFDFISIVDPRECSKINSLLPVIKRFGFLKDFIDIQKLDNEWRGCYLIDSDNLGLSPNYSVEEYWSKVFALKNAADQPLYPNLRIVISLLLVLPFSNVSVERIFSKLKNVKTSHINSLKTDTVAAIITSSEAIAEQGGCIKFTPNKKMLSCDIYRKI